MMAGVVRRDGLREAVTKLRDEWVADEGRTWISNCGDELSRILDAVPDVPPTTPLANHIKAGMLRGRVRLSDVPPRPSEPSDGLSGDLASKSPIDPPAADREQVFSIIAAIIPDHPMWQGVDYTMTRERLITEFVIEATDAILSSGVLVDVADVRAREADAIAHAIREAAKKPPHILADNAQRVWMAGMDRAQKIAAGIAAGIRIGTDRAASERDRGTT